MERWRDGEMERERWRDGEGEKQKFDGVDVNFWEASVLKISNS